MDEVQTLARRRSMRWSGDAELVRSVLEDASEPMTAMEIAKEIHRRTGEPIPHATVFHVLTRSRSAQRGMFEPVKQGRYRLAS